jgi:hypothetical protein
MARRKNVKRIDPRYFLNETVDRNDDGSRMEESNQCVSCLAEAGRCTCDHTGCHSNPAGQHDCDTGHRLEETGADVKSAGLPHNLRDVSAVKKHVRAMVDDGKVTPQNAKKIDAALRSLLGQNQSPEDTEDLQDLRAQVKDAAGIDDWQGRRTQHYRDAASDAGAAQKAGKRSTFDSFNAMGLGTPKRGWEE